jgi:arylsulfatase A-like enzyme
MSGKWHLTNERKIDGMVTDSWPKQRGFDRFFGIVPGGANYFTPVVYSDNKRYPAPDGFYLTDAISDTTVRYLIDEQIVSSERAAVLSSPSFVVPENGNYQLAFDFRNLNAGDEVWIDDVKLVPVEN